MLKKVSSENQLGPYLNYISKNGLTPILNPIKWLVQCTLYNVPSRIYVIVQCTIYLLLSFKIWWNI